MHLFFLRACCFSWPVSGMLDGMGSYGALAIYICCRVLYPFQTSKNKQSVLLISMLTPVRSIDLYGCRPDGDGVGRVHYI